MSCCTAPAALPSQPMRLGRTGSQGSEKSPGYGHISSDSTTASSVKFGARGTGSTTASSSSNDSWPLPSLLNRQSWRQSFKSGHAAHSLPPPRGTLRFPMHVVSVRDILVMIEVKPHQELMLGGKLHEFQPDMTVIFISHQWTGRLHPDKHADQFKILQLALKNLIAGDTKLRVCPCTTFHTGRLSLKTSSETIRTLTDAYVWYDYFSIPQPAAPGAPPNVLELLTQAVDSIPSYVERCRHFISLVPLVKHFDSQEYLCQPTYLERGWCRAEIAAWALSDPPGKPIWWVWAPGIIAEGTPICWVLFAPISGVFGVESDRARVDRLITTVIDNRLQIQKDRHDMKNYRFLKALRANYVASDQQELSDLAAWLERYCFTGRSATKQRTVGWSPIHFAAMEGNCHILSKLVAAGVPVDVPTKKWRSDLLACQRGMTAAHVAALYLPAEACIVVLRLLKNLGANFKKACDLVGQTVLHFACMRDDREVVIEYLLHQNSDVDVRTVTGDTPLMQCCQAGLMKTAKCLLEQGANVNAINMCGQSPLMQAAIMSSNPLIELLLAANADPNHSARMPQMMKIAGRVGLAFKPDAMIYDILQEGGCRTPLLTAACTGNTGAVDALLQAGAHPEATNCNGHNAMDHVQRYSQAPEILELLRQQDSEPESSDDDETD